MLRSVAGRTLNDKAMSLDAPQSAFDEGAAYRRVLNSQRDYMARQKVYWDFGDINQGMSETPTSPGPSPANAPPHAVREDRRR